MMNSYNMKLYAIRDNVTQMHTVFNASDDRVAKKNFESFLNDVPKEFKNDYTLISVGSYDLFKGNITAEYAQVVMGDEMEENEDE